MRRIDLNTAEQWALLAVVAFLPAVEAPKNIAVVLFIVLWAVNRWRSRDWGGPWSGWDSTVLCLIAGAYASVFFGAFMPNKGMAAAHDVLVYGLVFLALRRSSYDAKFLWRLLAVAVVATLLTLLYGYWGLLVTKKRVWLGLNSVGHVNHSAIYIAIVFSVALSWAGAAVGPLRQRVWLWTGAAALWISLFVTQSRGAVIPAVAFVLIWLFARAAMMKRALWKPALLVVVMVAGAILLAPGVLNKTRTNAEENQQGSYRPALARSSILAAREYPFFGLGINNFNKMNPELAAQWQAKSGQLFAPEDLWFTAHAHGLYFNTLAERGLVGLLPLLIFLAGIGLALFRHRMRNTDSPLQKTLWGGALGAWVVTVLGGLFNTTFHHEHGLITMILIAIWLAQLRPGVSDSPP